MCTHHRLIDLRGMGERGGVLPLGEYMSIAFFTYLMYLSVSTFLIQVDASRSIMSEHFVIVKISVDKRTCEVDFRGFLFGS